MNNFKFNSYTPLLACPIINLAVNSLFYFLNLSAFYFSFWQVLTTYGLIYVIVFFVKELKTKKLIYITIFYSILWPVLDLFRGYF